MALVNGSDYDHIDLHSAEGSDVTRHMLKDAQARADVADLKSAVIYSFNDSSLFEMGAIASTEGGNSSNSSTTRIRTISYIPNIAKKVKANTGYKYCLAAYNSSRTYQGMWDGSQLKTSATWLTGETILSSVGTNLQYRVVLAKSEDGTITTSDGSNLVFVAVTDDALTKSGVPADAKTVGDKIAELRAFEGIEITSSIANWTSSYIIRSDNGRTTYTTGYKCSGFVDISSASVIRFQTINATEGSIRAACAFYESDETFISAVQRFSETTGYAFVDVVVPANAKYVRFTKFSDEAVPFSVFVVKAETWGPFTQIKANQNAISTIIAENPKPVCYKTETQFYMYIPTANKKYYIQYTFSHSQNAETNADGWRLTYCYLCNLDKTHVKYITYTGEWEMAIKLNGRNDHIGLGNHGDEIETLFKLFVDGDEITENAEFTDRVFETVQLVNKLTMYDPNDSTTVVGYHTRIDTVSALTKTVTVENQVEFLSNYQIDAGYLFMASLSRYHDDVQITDAFIDNQDYILTDCSTQTFDPADASHGVGEAKHGATEYKFWGSGLDLYGYARIKRRVAPSGNTLTTRISNDASYNKIYYSMCSNGESVSAGDKWILETEFFLDFGYNPA